MLHWNTNAQHRVHKRPSLDPVQSQFKRIHIFRTCFSNVHFNIFLSLRLDLLLQFLKQNILHFFMKRFIFWDITPYSLKKVNRRFGRTCRLHLQSRRISQARNQRESRWQAERTLKMEAACSSETSVDFQQTPRRYIPKDRNLHIFCFPYTFYIPHFPFYRPNNITRSLLLLLVSGDLKFKLFNGDFINFVNSVTLINLSTMKTEQRIQSDIWWGKPWKAAALKTKL
jgi:hypothetical protein